MYFMWRNFQIGTSTSLVIFGYLNELFCYCKTIEINVCHFLHPTWLFSHGANVSVCTGNTLLFIVLTVNQKFGAVITMSVFVILIREDKQGNQWPLSNTGLTKGYVSKSHLEDWFGLPSS